MNVRILVMLTGFFVFSAIGMPAPKPSLIKIIRDKEKSEDQKIAAIEQLIKEGINVNTKSEDIPYFTPLMIAADLGYINVVKALLDRGADINAMDNLHTPAIFYAAPLISKGPVQEHMKEF